jgi:DNA-directed RNA polymerase specialized sigma24 family protein
VVARAEAVSDASLVEAARAGPPRDREAYRVLYERYAPVVHSVLLARVQPADADDLLHECS